MMKRFWGILSAAMVFASLAAADSVQGQTYYSGYSPNGYYYPSNVPVVVNPPTVVVGRPPTIYGYAYPSRTVINNATRGTVVESTHNGNGYIASPGSSYQSVIVNGPSIYPSTTVIQTSEPPVVIQSRLTSTPVRQIEPVRLPNKDLTSIVLSLPKEAAGPLTYRLNGTLYSIKPGYSQSFPADRRWTIEFLKSGQIGQPIAYDLNAGTFAFVSDQNGWDLRQVVALPAMPMPAPASPILPPPSGPVLAPIPAPDL